MRSVVGSLTANRFGRIAAAAVLAGFVWISAHYSWAWLAAAISFVLSATFGALVSEKVPIVMERVSGTDPLNVAGGADVSYYSDGWAVVLPHDLDARTTPPQGLEHLEARSRLFEVGAFDLRETHLLFTLEGRSVDPVRVTGLRSRITARQAPLSGAVVRSPSAGEQQIFAAHFDLDQDEASACSEDGYEYFRDYTLTLARGESFMYRIIARVERSACEWELVVNYSHRDSERELVVDNAGEPFRTAARSEQVAGSYEWAWYEQPSRLIQSAHD